MFHRRFPEQFGLVREDIVWHEDSEWPLRARVEGYRVLAVSATGLIHHANTTTKYVRGDHYMDGHDEILKEVFDGFYEKRRAFQASKTEWNAQ
jgi:hypothetical protein